MFFIFKYFKFVNNRYRITINRVGAVLRLRLAVNCIYCLFSRCFQFSNLYKNNLNNRFLIACSITFSYSMIM